MKGENPSEEGVSFLIPIYNEAHALPATLTHLINSIAHAEIANWEIVIVDDGSTDDIAEVVFKYTDRRILLIRQENQGRLRARLKGLENSHYPNVILLDSRVHVSPSSLRYLMSNYGLSTRTVVSGPTRFPSDTPLVGLFWESISRIVWWRYYSVDSKIFLNETNFNLYPKGTTLLYVPTEVMFNESLKALRDSGGRKHQNDDTAILRDIVKVNSFVIDRNFDAIYHPRTSLFKFMKHAKHRGTVFISGFFPSIKYSAKLLISLAVFFLVSLFLTAFLLSPVLILLSFIFAELGLFTLSILRQLPRRNISSLMLIAPIFAPLYVFGILQSLIER